MKIKKEKVKNKKFKLKKQKVEEISKEYLEELVYKKRIFSILLYVYFEKDRFFILLK